MWIEVNYVFIHNFFFQRDRFKPNNCIRKVTLDLKKKLHQHYSAIFGLSSKAIKTKEHHS